MRRYLAAVLGVVAALLLSSCGVQADSEPRAIPSEVLEALNPQDPADDSGAVVYELWFVRNSKILPVERRSESEVTPELELEQLEVGPTEPERDEGLRTAFVPGLGETSLASTAESLDLTVPAGFKQTAVVLDDAFTDLPGDEQLLLLGQVVYTLATEDDESVLFVNSSGIAVGVPLPNGKLSSGAVRRGNYAALVADSVDALVER